MILPWNRKELLLTRSMSDQARIREILAANEIDYVIKVRIGHVQALPTKQWALFGRLGENQDASCEYQIFISKKDYERAQWLIRTIK